MRKIHFYLMILVISTVTELNAQNYDRNKLHFSSKDYTYQSDDKYNPALCGVSSLVIPGLGQIIAGEYSRGLKFTAFTYGSLALSFSCYFWAVFQETESDFNTYSTLSGIFLGAYFASGIWSVFDAVKVAKINNLYYRSLRKTSDVNFQILPSVAAINIGNNTTYPVGLKMKLTF